MTFVSTRVQSGLSRREYDEAIVKMSQSKALTKKDKEILANIDIWIFTFPGSAAKFGSWMGTVILSINWKCTIDGLPAKKC